MDAASVLDRIRARYDGLVGHEAWGERALFYNPGEDLPQGAYFVTLKRRDGDNDRASALDRDGVYRLNFSVSKATYRDRFGALPARPPKGGVVDTGHDFTLVDDLLPHPVYGWAGWVCVLSPSEGTLETLWPLVDEAYERAMGTYERRLREQRAH